MYIYISLSLYIYVSISLSLYIYIYIYDGRPGLPLQGRVGARLQRRGEPREDAAGACGAVAADGVGTPPTPAPEIWKLVLLMKFSSSYIFLNWLSGALVGVGDSEFIGNNGGVCFFAGTLHGGW